MNCNDTIFGKILFSSRITFRSIPSRVIFLLYFGGTRVVEHFQPTCSSSGLRLQAGSAGVPDLCRSKIKNAVSISSQMKGIESKILIYTSGCRALLFFDEKRRVIQAGLIFRESGGKNNLEWKDDVRAV